jgi:hypothetical protein
VATHQTGDFEFPVVLDLERLAWVAREVNTSELICLDDRAGAANPVVVRSM